MRGRENLGIGCLRHTQVFLGFLVSGIAPQRFIELDNGLGDLALGEVHSAEIIVGNCQFRDLPEVQPCKSLPPPSDFLSQKVRPRGEAQRTGNSA